MVLLNALPEGIARPPRKEDYFDIVRGLRPFIEDEEMQLRSSLMLMRDRAIATKNSPRISDHAFDILDVVHRIADDHAMNFRVRLDDLREIRRNCLNLICAASSLDAMFRAPPEQPEAA